MSNAPYTVLHLKYQYRQTLAASDRPLRPAIDTGLFHHGEVGATLAVINEVANQLGLESLQWCHLMEEALRNELGALPEREDILCALHAVVAARLFEEGSGSDLHR